MSYKGIQEWKWTTSWIDKYLDDAEAMVEAKKLAESRVEPPSTDVPPPPELVNASEKVSCAAVGCRKKGIVGCCRRMCFQCCSQDNTGDICQLHFLKKKTFDDETMLLREYLSGKSGRKEHSFYHHEEKLTKVGQTVVIWCFQDFLSHPKWSEPTFTSLRQQQRRNRDARRRSPIVSTSAGGSIAHKATGRRRRGSSSSPVKKLKLADGISVLDSTERSESCESGDHSLSIQ